MSTPVNPSPIVPEPRRSSIRLPRPPWIGVVGGNDDRRRGSGSPPRESSFFRSPPVVTLHAGHPAVMPAAAPSLPPRVAIKTSAAAVDRGGGEGDNRRRHRGYELAATRVSLFEK